MGIHAMSLGGWSSYGSRAIFHNESTAEPSSSPTSTVTARPRTRRSTGGCSRSRTPASADRRTRRRSPARASRASQRRRRADRPGSARARARDDDEEIRTLHPAVARPGRRAANVRRAARRRRGARLARRARRRGDGPDEPDPRLAYAQVEGYDRARRRPRSGPGDDRRSRVASSWSPARERRACWRSAASALAPPRRRRLGRLRAAPAARDDRARPAHARRPGRTAPASPARSCG